MAVLSDDQLSSFRRNGYVRIEQAVPDDHCDAVVDAIWDFLGKSPNEPETWYGPPSGLDEPAHGQFAGMVNLYQQQALWDNRQHPDVYEAFTRILDESDLWVSLDRCNMTPPRREEYPEYTSSFIHWDVDTSPLPERPVDETGTPAVPFGVQGVLYLDDTTEEMGGFQCVPDLYRELDEWVQTAPDDRDPFEPDLDGQYEIESIPGEKGDLVIWDSLLAHGNGHNETDRPRLAQYLTMSPARPSDEDARRNRIESWRNQRAPIEERRDPRGREAERYERAELSGLGERLLGLERWED
jgi:hypothetical protein